MTTPRRTFAARSGSAGGAREGATHNGSAMPVGRGRGPAKSTGLSAEEWAQRVSAAMRLLDGWSKGDEREQRETWERLRKALNEDRQGTRLLFP